MPSNKPIKLNSPRIRVIFGDEAAPSSDSWDVVEVQTTGRDMQAAEQLFARHKDWGSFRDNPIRFQNTLGWLALNRRGLYEHKLEQFLADVIEVQSVDDDEEDTDDADGGLAGDLWEGSGEAGPTQPGAGLD